MYEVPKAPEQKESTEEMLRRELDETDNQGNPLNENGTLKLEKIKSIDELADEDFSKPTRNVELPTLPKNVDEAIGANGKPVIIKKNVLEKNRDSHKDLTPEQSRLILNDALYRPDLYGQNQKLTRPYNWILIHLADKNEAIIVEVNPTKDNVEIVNWHYLRGESLEQKKKQAIAEGGRILTLESAVGDTHNGLSSAGKGTINSVNEQRKAQKANEKDEEQGTNASSNPLLDEFNRLAKKSKRSAEKFAEEQINKLRNEYMDASTDGDRPKAKAAKKQMDTLREAVKKLNEGIKAKNEANEAKPSEGQAAESAKKPEPKREESTPEEGRQLSPAAKNILRQHGGDVSKAVADINGRMVKSQAKIDQIESDPTYKENVAKKDIANEKAKMVTYKSLLDELTGTKPKDTNSIVEAAKGTVREIGSVKEAKDAFDKLCERQAEASTEEEKDEIVKQKAEILRKFVGDKAEVVETFSQLVDGAADVDKPYIEAALEKGIAITGYYSQNGKKTFVCAEGIISAEDASETIAHEGQHQYNDVVDGGKFVNELAAEKTPEELEGMLETLVGKKVLKKYKNLRSNYQNESDYKRMLADEISAFAAERLAMGKRITGIDKETSNKLKQLYKERLDYEKGRNLSSKRSESIRSNERQEARRVDASDGQPSGYDNGRGHHEDGQGAKEQRQPKSGEQLTLFALRHDNAGSTLTFAKGVRCQRKNELSSAIMTLNNTYLHLNEKLKDGAEDYKGYILFGDDCYLYSTENGYESFIEKRVPIDATHYNEIKQIIKDYGTDDISKSLASDIETLERGRQQVSDIVDHIRRGGDRRIGNSNWRQSERNGASNVRERDSWKDNSNQGQKREELQPSRISVELHKDYVDAVSRGATDTAEKMVRDAAAKAMPNTKVVDGEGKNYHNPIPKDDDSPLRFASGNSGYAKREEENIAAEAAKDDVFDYFRKSVSGEVTGKPKAIGNLTKEGRKFLEELSGLSMKENVSFVLNPSDMRHIYNDHFGVNEKDKGNNIPLTEKDIRNIVDAINRPESVLFGIEKKEAHRKLFFFISPSENGTYSLTEVCSTKKGNLTAKSFFNTKKGITQRVMEIKDTLLPTSVTYSGESLSSVKVPQLFELPKDLNNFFGNESPRLDADYLDAVSRGATDTAEKMVRDAAA